MNDFFHNCEKNMKKSRRRRGKSNRFMQVTLHGVYTSMPKKLSKNDEESFIFAAKALDGKLQIVEVIYDMKPICCSKVINVYTFSPKD